MSDQDIIEGAVLAALGHIKPDYRSTKRLNDAAKVIAEFVMAALARKQS